MKRVFIEAKDFQKKLDSLKDVDLLQKLQEAIAKDPEIGDLVKETGGIRKFRMGTKGKGKSGGVRAFYLDVPNKEKCYLLFLLKKFDSDNISDEEKNELKQISQFLKK